MNLPVRQFSLPVRNHVLMSRGHVRMSYNNRNFETGNSDKKKAEVIFVSGFLVNPPPLRPKGTTLGDHATATANSNRRGLNTNRRAIKTDPTTRRRQREEGRVPRYRVAFTSSSTDIRPSYCSTTSTTPMRDSTGVASTLDEALRVTSSSSSPSSVGLHEPLFFSS